MICEKQNDNFTEIMLFTPLVNNIKYGNQGNQLPRLFALHQSTANCEKPISRQV